MVSGLSKISIVLLGGSCTGKNTIMKTAASVFPSKQTKDGKTIITVEIAGEKYDVRMSSFYDTGLTQTEQSEIASADGFFIVYDVTNKFTIERAKMYQKKIVQVCDKSGEDLPLILIGNKCDSKNRRQLDVEEGMKLSESFQSTYIETCALPNKPKSIDFAFKELIKMIINLHKKNNIHLYNKSTSKTSIKNLFQSAASESQASVISERKRLAERRKRMASTANNQEEP